MSTTDRQATLTIALTGIYQAIRAAGVSDAHFDALAERVELFYDLDELEEFVSMVTIRVEDGRTAYSAAMEAAAMLVDDGLFEAARAHGGGWDALYGAPEAEDPIYADYYHGVAHALLAGDGLRLCTTIGHETPDLDVAEALVAVAVTPDQAMGLVSVTVIPRSTMVHQAFGSLPEGVVEGVTTLVLDWEEQVYIRH